MNAFRVLIVEDNLIIRERLDQAVSKIFRQKNEFELFVPDSQITCERAINSGPFDLVLLDLALYDYPNYLVDHPISSGVGVLAALQETRTVKTPIILSLSSSRDFITRTIPDWGFTSLNTEPIDKTASTEELTISLSVLLEASLKEGRKGNQEKTNQ